MTIWTKPEFTEVCMNAEIGAYQDEFGGEGPRPEDFLESAEVTRQGEGSPRRHQGARGR